MVLAAAGKDISAWSQADASKQIQKAGHEFVLTVRRFANSHMRNKYGNEAFKFDFKRVESKSKRK